MPVVNGRLTCATCGADLGDAGDPYRDPDCHECLRREHEAEADDDAERVAELEAALERNAEAMRLVCRQREDLELEDRELHHEREAILRALAYWR